MDHLRAALRRARLWALFWLLTAGEWIVDHPHRALAVLVVVTLATGASTGAYLHVPEVLVPGLAGLPLSRARALGWAHGVVLEVTDHVPSISAAEGTVVAQRPSPGRRVRRGRIVSVLVSRGPEMVRAPDVEGTPLEWAQLAVEPSGLTPGPVIRIYSDGTDKGVVVSQYPRPGARILRGTPLALVVSRGPRIVRIPLVVGRSLREARRRLAALGLPIRHIVRVVSPDLEPGTVVGQNPEPGVRVRASTVEIVLTVTVHPEGRVGDFPPRPRRSAGAR